MYPHLAQIELDLTQVLVVGGISGLIGVLVTVAIVIVLTRLSKGVLVEKEADADQQRSVTHMLVDTSKQIGDLHNIMAGLQSKMFEMSEHRTKDREAIATLEGKLELANYRIVELDNLVRIHEKTIATLEQKHERVANERNTWRQRYENSERENKQLRERDIYISEENKILKLENERYKSYQRKQDTQPIPEIEVENLETPSLTSDMASDSAATMSADDSTNENDETPIGRTEENEIPEAN